MTFIYQKYPSLLFKKVQMQILTMVHLLTFTNTALDIIET